MISSLNEVYKYVLIVKCLFLLLSFVYALLSEL